MRGEAVDVVVVGAGQAGLAMSACLTARSVEHVVLDRDDVAGSWRSERWDSLRLLTPNWLTRLPGWRYDGAEPDGFMTAAEVVAFLTRYRHAVDAPVRPATAVASIAPVDGGFAVSTAAGPLTARAVVVASGACSHPRIPHLAAALPARILQLAPTQYRRPADVPDGRVLVVGASASGVQLADELARHGRDVTLAVGAHTRVPRTWRGRDIHWWMERTGLLHTSLDDVDDRVRARRQPSLQLVGSRERRSLGLTELAAAGVELVGRLAGVDGERALLSGGLAAACADADLKLGRLLDQIDAFAAAHRLDAPPEERPPATRVAEPRTRIDLGDVGTVVWATGFAPRHPFLDPCLVDARGAVAHHRGIAPTPGLYVLGLPWLQRRSSAFIDGVGHDARLLAAHLRAFLDRTSRRPGEASTSGSAVAISGGCERPT